MARFLVTSGHQEDIFYDKMANVFEMYAPF